jgi:hypothetical protein
MNKIAKMSYKNPGQSNSSSSLNKQQAVESNSQYNINDENKSPMTSRKKYLWSRSTSKDG